MPSAFRVPASALLDQLKEVVGPSGWRGAADAARYFDDPRGRFHGGAALVLMPENTAQVSAIVQRCNEAGVGIIPFGGGTGVVAGQISIHSGAAIILSLERMNRIREISPDDGVMVVEAGCVLENVHSAAEAQGMMFPLSMASKGSCCIGGNLATNAGGIQVVRHGNARDLCLGLEAVLPDGAIYSGLSPLRKDNTGYDLRHLLIGSEGTLGVITAATLVLKPLDPETVTVLCAVASPAAALGLYRQLRGLLGESLSALELMSGFGMDLVTSHFPDLPLPFAERHDWYLLLEAGGQAGLKGQAEAALAQSFEAGHLLDAVVAQSESQRAALWALREYTPEANRSGGAFCSSDTSVPLSKVEAFIHLTQKMVADLHPRVRINTYGHIGDGNIHHNVLPPEGVAKAEFLKAHPGINDAVRQAINEATLAFSGSISAEHGIGRLKAGDLQACADPVKYDTLRRIKSALDPNNIMNPGALLP